ncbi:hypothetical protein CEXT_546071 [Caerostris extrusa]|uniref:Uncharacterized protein n=1 Tax=Caerostris extrusa TaxID=172846 RepID=A0AAV4QHX0_CAEEX|nr:hypothetical protein CEXT_546071 [Caerostris extrusa]
MSQLCLRGAKSWKKRCVLRGHVISLPHDDGLSLRTLLKRFTQKLPVLSLRLEKDTHINIRSSTTLH